MIILLPPSEGKSGLSGAGAFSKLAPALLDDAGVVLRHVDGLSKAARGKFYGQKDGGKAAAMHGKNMAVADGACMKALERYTGVVYQNIDYAGLRAKRRAEKRIYVVSGLFGLISGGAQIPDYKVPINGWLAKYWREINGARLEEVAKGKRVLSLLPQAYSKAIEYESLLHVDFRLDGGKKAAGHFGKAIKGRFVRYLLENDVTSAEDFAGFREEGYVFNGTDFVKS